MGLSRPAERPVRGAAPPPAGSNPSAGALAALHDPARGRPVITYGFLVLCLLVTLPSLAFPQLYDILGGIAPRRHWWQPLTAAFEHGWPGFPGSIHLALNLFLILECGRPCERLLGSGRFLLLGVAALAASAGAQTLTEGVNGSSVVIWAWGPPLAAALVWARRRDPEVAATAAYRRLRGILVLMYGVVVLVMGALPYLAGWRGNPLVALLRANLFHLVATGIGILLTGAFAGSIRDRLTAMAHPGHGG